MSMLSLREVICPSLEDWRKIASFDRIAVCALAGVAASMFPSAWRLRGLLLISLVSVLFLSRERFLADFAYDAIVYLFIRGVARVAERQPTMYRWNASCRGIIILIVAFAVGRHYAPDPGALADTTHSSVPWSLDMWHLLRLVIVLWEFGARRIEVPNLGLYVTWCMLPLTLAGPLIRFSEFKEQLSVPTMHMPRVWRLQSWWLRLGKGLFALYLGIICSLIPSLLFPEPLVKPVWAKILIGYGLSPWGFLLLVGGLFLVMEQLANLFALRLPRSFDYPFGRPNLSEFWMRWNMTATAVFRDTLFMNRWGLSKANLYLNSMIVFLMVGLWHGGNLYWTLWGLLHGCGFCVFLWFRVLMARQRRLQDLLPPWLGTAGGAIVTYLFVCSCWIIPSQILLRWVRF